MKSFSYEVAINQLELGKGRKLNENIKVDLIPMKWKNNAFTGLFLPYLKIIGDSREQDKWIESACSYYGIAFEWAKKDRKEKTENLKEGDYSYQVIFENKTYDFIGRVAYERKGSVSELYNNCTAQKSLKSGKATDRDRIKREFDRFREKEYKKVVLILEFGEKIEDLINMEFSYRGEGGKIVRKNTFNTIYAAMMSWKQPNNKKFEIIQSNNHMNLFWQVLQDMYYYFRNELRIECEEKGLIENI